MSKWELGTQKIKDGVYAYYTEGTLMRSNCGIISGTESSLLFDTLSTEKMYRDFLHATESCCSPRKFLALSHGHGDHIMTVHLVPETTVIAQTKTRDFMIEGDARLREVVAKNATPGLDFTGCRTVLPQIYFEKELIVSLGERDILLRYPGDCHTQGDIYAYDKNSGTVFCGDLLFYKVAPVAIYNPLETWICAMDEMLSLDAENYIPGHGPICGKKEVSLFRDYLQQMKEVAEDGFSKGIPSEEAVKQAHWGEVAFWEEPGRTYNNVEKAYCDLQKSNYVFDYNFARSLQQIPE